MKALTIFLFLLPIHVLAQNGEQFQSYWTLEMQYNLEITSVFKQSNAPVRFPQFNIPALNISGEIESGSGYSWMMNGVFHSKEKLGILCFLGGGTRKFHRKFPFSAHKSTARIINHPELLRHTYDIFEIGGGVFFRPKVMGLVSFKLGFGLSQILNLKVESDLKESFRTRPGVFLHSDDRFLNGFPIFSFLAINFIVLKSANAQIFIEPHIKTDLFDRKASFLEQQFYTFGIGIGGRIKITN